MSARQDAYIVYLGHLRFWVQAESPSIAIDSVVHEIDHDIACALDGKPNVLKAKRDFFGRRHVSITVRKDRAK